MRIRSLSSPSAKLSTLASSLLVALSLSVSSVALADDDAVSRAAVLSREAEKLESEGKYGEACDKLEQSQSLDPRGGTILDLALCREKQGRVGTAYNLFEQAEKAAVAEKRSDRITTAKVHKNSLFAKLPRLTVTVPKESEVKGLEVSAGGQVIPQSEWGKAYPVDAGTIKVSASAPEKETWETTVEMKAGVKKAVSIPALKAGSGPAPKKAPDLTPSGNSGTSGPTTGGASGGTGATSGGSGSGGSKEPKASGHHKGRIVVEIGIQAGLHISAVSQAPQEQITGTQYKYKGDGGSEFLASCGDTTSVPGAGKCNATFNPQLALLLGGQMFLGYAFTDSLHFGGRVFGGAHLPLGYEILGGPSLSFKVSKPFWMGITALVGTTQVKAVVTGAKGSVPVDLQTANGNSDQVGISVKDLAGGLSGGGKIAPATGRLEIGGSLEVSYVLADAPTGITGSLMLSAWPTALWSQGGVVFAVPIGLSYRFH